MCNGQTITEELWRAFQDSWDAARLQQVSCRRSFERLCVHYGKDRHYHSLGHIYFGLQQMNPKLLAGVEDQIAALKLAWFYHDIRYDTRAPQGKNEQRSAAFARDVIKLAGGDPLLMDGVKNLIVATTHGDEPPQTLAEEIIADVDLIPLSIAWDDFEENSRQIREEYRNFVQNDADFSKQRASILRRFLASPHIYHTQYCRDRFEDAARANLGRALQIKE
jgi:predicted metal-dependent HD superfamily phosphohydrolase